MNKKYFKLKLKYVLVIVKLTSYTFGFYKMNEF